MYEYVLVVQYVLRPKPLILVPIPSIESFKIYLSKQTYCSSIKFKVCFIEIGIRKLSTTGDFNISFIYPDVVRNLAA